MRRLLTVIVGLFVIAGGIWFFGQSEVAKMLMGSSSDQFIQVMIFLAAVFVIVIGGFVVVYGLLVGPQRPSSNPIAIYRYESGVTIIDLGGSKSFKFRKNLKTGEVDYLGEILSNENGIFVTSIN